MRNLGKDADKIIAEERRSCQVAIRYGFANGLAMVTITLLAAIAVQCGFLVHEGVSSEATRQFAFWVPIGLMAILLVIVAWHTRRHKGAMTGRILCRKIDMHHRRWLRIILIPCILAVEAPFIGEFNHGRSFRPFLVFNEVPFGTVVVFRPAYLRNSYRNILNDMWRRRHAPCAQAI